MSRWAKAATWEIAEDAGIPLDDDMIKRWAEIIDERARLHGMVYGPDEKRLNEMLERAYADGDKWRNAVELAYGLLWSNLGSTSWLARRAKKVLLDAIREGYDGNTRPGQSAGIEAARELMQSEGVWEEHNANLERMLLSGAFDLPTELEPDAESGTSP